MHLSVSGHARQCSAPWLGSFNTNLYTASVNATTLAPHGDDCAGMAVCHPNARLANRTNQAVFADLRDDARDVLRRVLPAPAPEPEAELLRLRRRFTGLDGNPVKLVGTVVTA